MSKQHEGFKLIRYFLMLVIGFTGGFSFTAAADTQSQAGLQDRYEALGKSPLVAVGPDLELRLSDLDKGIDPELAETLQRLHEARLYVLRTSISAYVLEKEANVRGITAEALENELLKDVPEVTETDVDAFTARNRSKFSPQMLQDRGTIKFFLHKQRRDQVRKSMVADLVKSHEIRVDLPAPPVRRYELDSLVRLSEGDPDAPIHIVEFSDFECQYCQKAQATFKRLQREYGDRIKFSFKHFPLAIHPNAVYTALASECANDQGKFWEFKEAIFKTDKPGDRSVINQTAGGLDLNMLAFEKCFVEEKHRALIEKDKQDGKQLRVAATPTVFINGRKLRGAIYTNMKQVIDEELQAKSVLSQMSGNSQTGG